MDNLTYSISYTPNISTDVINPVCSDKKIHVRFRDYIKPQIIYGFEKKLTYLMTYLINYSSTASLAANCSPEMLLKLFVENADVQTIYGFLRYEKNLNFKGFKFFKNYHKFDCKEFGETCDSVFPLTYDMFNNPTVGDLDTFLKLLKIDLNTYLFNDAYAVVIGKWNFDDINIKFINREAKKASRITSDFVNLW